MSAITSIEQKKTLNVFKLDPSLKEECNTLIDLNFKKNAWKIASLAVLVLSGGALFYVALILFWISLIYSEELEDQLTMTTEETWEKIKRDMVVDFERGFVLRIDGIDYHAQSDWRTKDPYEPQDVVKGVIRVLKHEKKLDPFQLLLALKIAHQGMSSFPTRYLSNQLGTKFLVAGETYQRKVEILTHGKNVKVLSEDLFKIFKREESGELTQEPKAFKTKTTLDLKNKDIFILVKEES